VHRNGIFDEWNKCAPRAADRMSKPSAHSRPTTTPALSTNKPEPATVSASVRTNIPHVLAYAGFPWRFLEFSGELLERKPVCRDGARPTRVGSAVRRKNADRACATHQQSVASANSRETPGPGGHRAPAPSAGQPTHERRDTGECRVAVSTPPKHVTTRLAIQSYGFNPPFKAISNCA
jgi:hypothetical protein